MEKYDAIMMENGKKFNYSISANDIFEADQSAQKTAQSRGWVHVETNPRQTKNKFEQRLEKAEASKASNLFGFENETTKKKHM